MDLYASTACLSNKYIKDSVEELAHAGFTNIELSGGTEYYEGLWEDLRHLQEKYNLTYACHAYFPPPQEHFVVNLASCNDEIYERSKKHYVDCIGQLSKIACKVLSIHAGFLVEVTPNTIGQVIPTEMIYDEEEAYCRFKKAYKYISTLCKKKGIKLYLENNVFSKANYESFGGNNYFMMTDYRSIMKMKAVLDFDLLLDLGHLHVSSKTLRLDYADECQKLSKYVRWCHMSHNDGIVDQHRSLESGCEELVEYKKHRFDMWPTTLETVDDIRRVVQSKECIICGPEFCKKGLML